MFGPYMYIEFDGFGVTLCPFERAEVTHITKHFSSLQLHMYTNRSVGAVMEDEYSWWDKTRTDSKTISWGIIPNGSDHIVGTTAIHGINEVGGCSTGIIIFDTEWHGKGVASRAHLLRTYYAADFLARLTITTHVFSENVASRRALQRVGYEVTGTELRTRYRKGVYMDTNTLSWLHPEKLALLYPDGSVPTAMLPAIERAQAALDKARALVKL